MHNDVNNGATIDTNTGTVINQPGGTILLAAKQNYLSHIPAKKLKFERMRLKEKLSTIYELYTLPLMGLGVSLSLLFISLFGNFTSESFLIIIGIMGFFFLWITFIYSKNKIHIKRYKNMLDNIEAELKDRE